MRRLSPGRGGALLYCSRTPRRGQRHAVAVPTQPHDGRWHRGPGTDGLKRHRPRCDAYPATNQTMTASPVAQILSDFLMATTSFRESGFLGVVVNYNTKQYCKPPSDRRGGWRLSWQSAALQRVKMAGPDRHARRAASPRHARPGIRQNQRESFMKTPVNVAITGAAGQIGYALAFRVASGQMLGPDQPVNLHLLEITPALGALQGVVMELNDCAFPTLNKIVATDDAEGRVQGLPRCAARRRAPARPGHGAQGPAARQRADLLGAGQGARRRRRPQRARAGRRQPGEHQLADRDEERAEPRTRSTSRR